MKCQAELRKSLHCLLAGKASSAPRDTSNDQTMRDTSALASLLLRHNYEHDGGLRSQWKTVAVTITTVLQIGASYC